MPSESLRNFGVIHSNHLTLDAMRCFARLIIKLVRQVVMECIYCSSGLISDKPFPIGEALNRLGDNRVSPELQAVDFTGPEVCRSSQSADSHSFVLLIRYLAEDRLSMAHSESYLITPWI